MKRTVISFLLSLLAVCSAVAQNVTARMFDAACDTLSCRLKSRTTVDVKLALKSVMKRGSTLDFYFTESLGDFPWKSQDVRWFKSELKNCFPESLKSYALGGIYCKSVPFDELVTPSLSNGGSPVQSAYKVKNVKSVPLVRKMHAGTFDKGMSGRTIALWQSHGRYFDQGAGDWSWQRPPLFGTVEDIFTQTFVVPFLVPMLENSGAVVILPRERDLKREEVIADNDPAFDRTESSPSVRGCGTYSETGGWKDAGTGFADVREVYVDLENPFTSGTARMTGCCSSPKHKDYSMAEWTVKVPRRDNYAVYVSYKTLPNSTSAARYSVRHAGGKSEFSVNQTMGGGTWVYLGSFDFDPSSEAVVTLDNVSQDKNKVVTADAVKIGGGMGNVARYNLQDGVSEARVSGLPRFVEGARYWMQWSGVPDEVYSQNEQKQDYRDDFMSRGAWVRWLSGGSRVNPKGKGLGIPVDLAFAMHSDAGITPNDSIVGTLAIYTLMCDGSRKMPDQEDRMTCREYTDIIQTQVVNDIRAQWNPEWSRRQIWDRSYSESRTTGVPTVLLELLSHQNFADMKYGLDPMFRFTVSRAVYKGMLKYLANRYGCSYVVQPLPVHSFAAVMKDGGKVMLSWKETADTLEPTANAMGFAISRRIDDGGWSEFMPLNDVSKSEDGTYSAEVKIDRGHLFSFRIKAFNDGGYSFPSESLSAGIPEGVSPDRGTVLVVNNFTRVSGPAFVDMPDYAGFDNRLDSGVPYMYDPGFLGEMYDFRRQMEFLDNQNPGFGASFQHQAGKLVAGNVFDYPAVHGRALMEAGYPFCSCSVEAFCNDMDSAIWSVDLICGKQVTTAAGTRTDYTVFTPGLMDALRHCSAAGVHILVSGAHIGTDVWDRVYPVEIDEETAVSTREFVSDVLGYKWMTNYASRTGEVCSVSGGRNPFFTEDARRFFINNALSDRIYCVETPDGIVPSGKNSRTICRYADSSVSAGVAFTSGSYRTVCFGFPLETVTDSSALSGLIKDVMRFFEDR